MKETGKPFTETGPQRKELVIVKCGGQLLDAMVIATDGKKKSPIFNTKLKKEMTDQYFHSSLENEEKLNIEEKAFVEDPVNAALFEDPPTAKKRPNENRNEDQDEEQHVKSVPKKAKTSDEVS